MFRTLLENLDESQCDALVYSRRTNSFDVQSRAIVRKIQTPGGRQLVFHELISTRTGSGFYESFEDILSRMNSLHEKMQNTRFINGNEWTWREMNYIDVPIHLIV